MARVLASNGGFQHPGMHGAMGLFGSQGRPGMRASSSLGSLSGSTLGDATVEPSVTDISTADATKAAADAKAVADAAAKSSSNKRLLMIGGVAVAAYYLFLRKK